MASAWEVDCRGRAVVAVVVEEEEEEEEEDEEVAAGCLGVAIPIAVLNCSSILFFFFFFFLFLDDSLICWWEPCTVIPCMPKTALPILFLSL